MSGSPYRDSHSPVHSPSLFFCSSVRTGGHLQGTVNSMLPAVDWNVALPLASDDPCSD